MINVINRIEGIIKPFDTRYLMQEENRIKRQLYPSTCSYYSIYFPEIPTSITILQKDTVVAEGNVSHFKFYK